MKDYYKILGVSTNATKDEIKKAFRILAKKYHPDRNANDESAVQKFQDINEAYGILSNEKLREEYDNKKSSFKENQTQEKGFNRKGEQNNTRRRKNSSQSQGLDMEDLNKRFESFFGFSAKSNEINKDKLSKNKNPIDTSNMFESFFNIKKK